MNNALETLSERLRRHPKLVIADDFEIALERMQGRGRRFHNGELMAESQTERLWLSLRILHRKRGGKAAILNPSEESLNSLVEAAFESANRSAVDPWFRFPMWKPGKPAAAEDEGEVEYASLYSEVAGQVAALDESYEERSVETLLRRKTEKLELKHRRHSHHGSFSVVAQSGEQVAVLDDKRARSGLLGDRKAWIEELAHSAHEQVRMAAKPCGPGRRRAVLAPRVSAAILNAIAPYFCADSVQAGRSPYGELRGQKILPTCLTLCDDGNHPDSETRQPFDLEGVPTQRTVIIDQGTARSWLYDVYCATRENRLSTGNRLRAAGDLFPRLQPSTLFWQPGELSRQAVLEKMGSGIYINHLEALEPVVSQRGHFIARASGWRVTFGHLSEPLRDIEWEFDPLQLLSSTVCVGRDLAFYDGHGSPSILLEDMPLGI